MNLALSTDRLLARLRSPFPERVPGHVRDALVRLQLQRLVAAIPLLCLLIAANAIAMGVAVMGDLPLWQQLAPPIIIVSACLVTWARIRRMGTNVSAEKARAFMRHVPLVAVPLGLVAGVWGVSAFSETEEYYCMVAPVFIGIAALATASCLNAVPRAAIGAMTAAIAPIAVKMALFDNLGVRAMMVMMVLLTFMQARIVLAKYNDTVQTMLLQDELNRLASSDPLTGLDNRLTFDTVLRDLLATDEPVLVALTDLDGFKAVNDTYGHLVGDELLSEVADRMRQSAPSAASLARLGGDEFALIFAVGAGSETAELELAGMRAAIAAPFVHQGEIFGIETSLGIALTEESGRHRDALLRLADQRLYSDKSARRALRLAPGQADTLPAPVATAA